MQVFVLALLVTLVTGLPVDIYQPVDLVVNGVAEGEPLALDDIVSITLKEHNNGVATSASNLLYPLTAEGIAAAEAANNPVIVDDIALPSPVADTPDVPEAIVLPEPGTPVIVGEGNTIPEPIVIPEPGVPEVVEVKPIALPELGVPEIVETAPIVLPEPGVPEVVETEPIVLPEPGVPEVVETEPIVLPEPGAPEVVETGPIAQPEIPNGEIFNNGVVEIHLNTPQDAGVFSTIQTWLSFVVNYFNGEVQTSEQIV